MQESVCMDSSFYFITATVNESTVCSNSPIQCAIGVRMAVSSSERNVCLSVTSMVLTFTVSSVILVWHFNALH